LLVALPLQKGKEGDREKERERVCVNDKCNGLNTNTGKQRRGKCDAKQHG